MVKRDQVVVVAWHSAFIFADTRSQLYVGGGGVGREFYLQSEGVG